MRVAVLLATQGMAAGFLESGALDMVLEEHEVLCLHTDRTAELAADDRFSSSYEIESSSDVVHRRLFDITMWNRRKASGAFRLRSFRYFLGNGRIRSIRSAIAASRAWIPGVSRGQSIHPALVVLLGSRLLYPLALRSHQRRIRISPRIHAVFTELQPQVVLLPSSAYEGLTLDVIAAARRFGCPTIMLMHNWDNLSSKTVLWVRPDHVAVWGEQSAMHAIGIQGFRPEQVHVLGSPRGRRAAATRNRSSGAVQIAFLGCAIPHLECAAVEALSEQLARHPELGESRIVYRPHPARQKRVAPDDPVSLRGVGNVRVETGGDVYSLLQRSDIAVGPLTTALLEAVATGLPVVALTNDDGIHRTTAAAALRSFPHLEELPRLRGLRVCDDLSRVVDEITAALQGQADQSDILDLDYFMLSSGPPYAKRLAALVHSVSLGQRTGPADIDLEPTSGPRSGE